MFHYLDNAATTRVCPEAAQAALQVMSEDWGNPSSRYAFGRKAEEDMKRWRGMVAAALGCQGDEVYFTSCGSESDNWAIAAAVEYGKRKGKHIITSVLEHAAVLEPCKALERQGYEVTYLKPDKEGNIPMEDLAAALRPDTILVSLVLVNSELGTVTPMKEVSRIIKASGAPALLHTDAVQGFLKVPFTPKELGVDMVTVSGHKIHAPKGVGALYIRKGLKLSPFIRGGGQESGLRSGTEATSQIAAFAEAARVGKENLSEHLAHMKEIKQYAIRELTEQVPGLVVIGHSEAPHVLPISMPGYKSEVMLRFLSDRGVYVSSGSACHKGKPSHVYAALGLPKKVTDGILRVSLARTTTTEDIDALVEGLKAAGEQLFTSLS